MLRALALSLLTRYWRKIPIANTLAAPVMLFFAAERLLGTKQAALFGGLALWQPMVPWIVYGLDLWRTRCVALCKLLRCCVALKQPKFRTIELNDKHLVCCSHFVVPELLSDYIAHRVPGPKREDFMRANEVACFAFILPQVSEFCMYTAVRAWQAALLLCS